MPMGQAGPSCCSRDRNSDALPATHTDEDPHSFPYASKYMVPRCLRLSRRSALMNHAMITSVEGSHAWGVCDARKNQTREVSGNEIVESTLYIIMHKFSAKFKERASQNACTERSWRGSSSSSSSRTSGAAQRAACRQLAARVHAAVEWSRVYQRPSLSVSSPPPLQSQVLPLPQPPGPSGSQQ